MTESYNLICNICDYKTNIENSMTDHLKSNAHQYKKRGVTGKKVYTCDHCDYTTPNKNNFTMHTLNNHSSQEQRKTGFTYYCHTCDTGMMSTSSFKLHNKTKRHALLNENNTKNE